MFVRVASARGGVLQERPVKMTDRDFYKRFYRLEDSAPRDIDGDGAVWVRKDRHGRTESL